MDKSEQAVLDVLDFEAPKVCQGNHPNFPTCPGEVRYTVRHECCSYEWVCCDLHAAAIVKLQVRALNLATFVRCAHCFEPVNGPHLFPLGGA